LIVSAFSLKSVAIELSTLAIEPYIFSVLISNPFYNYCFELALVTTYLNEVLFKRPYNPSGIIIRTSLLFLVNNSAIKSAGCKSPALP